MLFDKFYFKSKLSEGLVALYSHSVIRNAGMGLFDLFSVIFLFEKFNHSINAVLLFFMVSFALFFFLVAVGAMMMSQIGLKRSMIWAAAFLTLSYLGYYYFFKAEHLVLLVGLVIVCETSFRMLFWIPFHTDFAKFTQDGSRGKQLSFLWSAISLTSFVVPVAAGFVIYNFGYPVLLIIVTTLIMASILPLFFLPDIREKFEYSYRQTFKELFGKKNRKILLAYGSDGAQSMAGIIWPIFIYQLLNQEYVAVGLVSSIIILSSIILQLAAGQFTDKIDKKQLIKLGSVLYALGWLGKAFVQTGFQIFIAGTYHNFSSIMMRTPFDTLMYDKAAGRGHYIDEFSVVREMAVNLGRVLMLGFLIMLFSFTSFGMGAAFVAAAIISLLINIL